MTARAEIYVRSKASCDLRLITIQCYDFDFLWTFVLDNEGLLGRMVSGVRQKLLRCVQHVASYAETQNDIYLVRAWIEIENAYEASCPFDIATGNFEYADKQSLAYDWFTVGLEAVPPPGQSLSQTLQNVSNYFLTTMVETPTVKQLAIKNLILPICNSLWLFLDIMQRFWTRSSYTDELNLLTREITDPRPLTNLVVASLQAPNLVLHILMPDSLNL